MSAASGKALRQVSDAPRRTGIFMNYADLPLAVVNRMRFLLMLDAEAVLTTGF